MPVLPCQGVLGCCPRRVDRPISDRAACPPERRSWRPTSNLRSCRCCHAKARSGAAPVASIDRSFLRSRQCFLHVRCNYIYMIWARLWHSAHSCARSSLAALASRPLASRPFLTGGRPRHLPMAACIGPGLTPLWRELPAYRLPTLTGMVWLALPSRAWGLPHWAPSGTSPWRRVVLPIKGVDRRIFPPAVPPRV